MGSPSFFGRYQVLRAHGTGQMGTVYVAEDPVIGRTVAIKCLNLETASDEHDRQRLQLRFEQEIRIVGKLSHPGIVTLFDVGRQDGQTFIAMEYVEGRSLREELRDRAPVDPQRVVEILEPICRALAYAHERGVVHRDVKPSNILLGSDGAIKLTDFGIARVTGVSLTMTGAVFGAPAYMSPEQAKGEPLTGASDQFAVGVIAYEMLTGRRPFFGPSPAQAIYQVVEHRPTSPRALDPEIPKTISDTVLRALEKRPERRFPSCSEFAAELRRGCVAGDGVAIAPTRRLLARLTSLRIAPVRDRLRAAALPPRWQDRWRRAVGQTRSFVTRVADERPWALPVTAFLVVLALGAGLGQLRGPGRPAGPSAGFDLVSPTPGTQGREAAEGSRLAGGDADLPPGGSAPQLSRRSPEDSTDLGDSVAGPLEFTVTSQPLGARVELDGVEVAPTPARIEVDGTDRHVLRVELPGYQPVAWTFSLDRLGEQHLRSRQLHFPLSSLTPPAWPLGETGAFPTLIRASDDLPSFEPPAANAASPRFASPLPAAYHEIRRLHAPADVPVPRRLWPPPPEIPAGAQIRRVALVELEINTRGAVVQAKIVRSAGAALDRAVLDAVVGWRYEPTILADGAVHVVMTTTVPVDQTTR